MSNKAAYIIGRQARPLVVRDAPMPVPGPDQVVIKVGAVAINPVDAVIQNLGIIVQQYPSVIGDDAAGEVTAVGANVKHLKVGDRVLACVDMDEGETVLNGLFQHYAITNHKLVGKIPDSIAYTDACVLPLGTATAATGLFDKRCMGLDLPRMGATSTGSTLLVWGGASSVGSCAIQLARGAGYEVITTSSTKNFDYCRSLGVKKIFDYSAPTVVMEIVEYLQNKTIAGAFNAVQGSEAMLACNEIVHKSKGYKHVGTVLPPGFPLPEGRPEEVTTSFNQSTWLKQNEVGQAVFVEWIPQALADGSYKCKPDARIVGEGLERIQDAIDTYSKGVSAAKIVVKIPQ